ncbi:MAG TPA: CHRD domain-containing protein [Thermoanaerobaculia bacterium]|nr:CHRD domain-containing protein [Thermoanaerobaculia bacterium]
MRNRSALRCSVLITIALLTAAPALAQTFVFDLRGSQEVPPVASSATGGCMGVLDQPNAEFTLTCVHNVIGATITHIHRAPAGANGDIVFDLGDPASPITATWSGMTPADIADLLAGNLYMNIHTAGRPSGEIRGQILPRTVDVVPFTADGGQVVPPNASSATANCTADLDEPAASLAIQCTHNVASPDSAHIHEGPFGTNGPIVFTFPSPASPLNANVPMTPLLVADFAATFLYLDMHSAGTEDDSGDEIRGQIGTPPAGATTGTVIIRKATFPSGGSGFTFTDTITPGAFGLNDGGTRTFNNVAPGTYTVAEDDPSSLGYTLADVSCDDADSTTDPNARNATIRVAAGEIVTCTFRNLETSPTDDIFVFHLSGDQEVPPIATPDRGGCMGRFDSGANELTLICTHDVDSPTLMHIHRAPVGANGDIVFDLGDPTSPVTATWSGMTPTNVADLFSGNFYINIHTSGRPSGEIRGQIVERSVDTVAFTADASQVVPPGASPATANCTANLEDLTATALAISCTHNLPAPDAAHVHQAPRGQNGPVVFTFPSPASPLNANVPMTPRLVADFAAFFLYLDIHGAGGSEDTATDEIRGQIATAVVPVTTATIRITKSTSPSGGTGFSFTDDVPGSPGTFTIDDGQTHTFTNVPLGTYAITESATVGYSLTDITCDDGDSTGDPFTRTATVNLQAGDVVTCTFRNLQSVASPQHFVFHLSGDQEVPPTGSTARGGCYGQLNAAAATFSIVCTHSVTDPTIAHIHRGAPGVNGPIAFDLDNPVSPIEATWTGMTPTDIAELLAGDLYVNIHTSGRPSGEIRGQIVPRSVDSFTFPADASQEVPPTDSPAAGLCSGDLGDDPSSLFVQCSHNAQSPTSIHLHSAPAGEDGPVVFDFNPNANPFSGNAPLTPRLIADFAAGFLYVNIHTADFPEGEIRGQLIAGAAPPANVAGVPTAETWALILMTLALALGAWWRMR